ncbi:MAG: hypothetical protein O2800_02265 [Planctomycetota bacterium]|nr:hypothetical protein [Planctomycetota bacterium]
MKGRVLIVIGVLLAWMLVAGVFWSHLIALLGEGEFASNPFGIWSGLWDSLRHSPEPGQLLVNVVQAVGLVTILIGIPLIQAVLIVVPVSMPTATSTRATSLYSSAIAAALVVSILTFLPIAMVADLPILFGSREPDSLGGMDGWFSLLLNIMLVLWLISWIIWMPILLYRARREPDRFERFVTNCVKGTAIGVGLSIPWYALVRSRDSCYCGMGSFWSLVVGLWSLVMLGGPLLIFLRRRRRTIQTRVCVACGYPRANEAGSICSECGAQFIPPTRVK